MIEIIPYISISCLFFALLFTRGQLSAQRALNKALKLELELKTKEEVMKQQKLFQPVKPEFKRVALREKDIPRLIECAKNGDYKRVAEILKYNTTEIEP